MANTKRHNRAFPTFLALTLSILSSLERCRYFRVQLRLHVTRLWLRAPILLTKNLEDRKAEEFYTRPTRLQVNNL